MTHNLLAAHAYVGPGKQHASWLHGDNCVLVPREQFPLQVAAIDALVAKALESGRAVPLRWRQQTLALGVPEGKPEDAHCVGGPASVSAVERAGVSGSVEAATRAAAPTAAKAPSGSPVAPGPAPKVQVPKAKSGSAWALGPTPPAAQKAAEQPGFPPLQAAGAETQTVPRPAAPAPATAGRSTGGGKGAGGKGPAPATAGRSAGGGKGAGGTGRSEHERAGPEASARAMVAAVVAARDVATLKQWGREGVAHAALVLGVGPLEPGVPGRGRTPVCRALLDEAWKRSGGPPAGFGYFLGRA